jgi:outer membrane protein assembly factor BamB
MELYPERSNDAPAPAGALLAPPRPALRALTELLVGDAQELPLPPITELTAALTTLAEGARHKALVPLIDAPAELALLRRGEAVLVSCYSTESTPEVHFLNRALPLEALLAAAAKATFEAADAERSPVSRQIAIRMAERALRAVVRADARPQEPAVKRRGGASEPSPALGPLAFGFEATIHPAALPASTRASRADIHALLFEGTLWAFVRERRIVLARGPIVLAAQRMVVAVRALLEAREAGRSLNLRLRAGGFHVAVRAAAGADEVSITLGGEGDAQITAAALTPAEAALPILRLASELLRTLVAVDRSQGRNLRVRALRDEVRALGRTVKRKKHLSFVNHDADRLRLEAERCARAPRPLQDASEARAPVAAPRPSPARSLRFGERWRVAMDGLDAAATFLCGDRLVVSTSQHTVALSRDLGEVLWARDGDGTTAMLAGTTLLRLASDGELELCDVSDGEPYASGRIAPRMGGESRGLFAGGPSLPPMAVLTEGPHRLVAIDLRTGEPRWRFTARAGGPLELTKVGRILLVACGEGSIHALDLGTGEDLWRHTRDARCPYAPVVAGDHVIVASVGGSDGAGALYGIDLFQGEPRFRAPLEAPLTAAPIAAGATLFAPLAGPEGGRLRAFDAATGEARYEVADPGLGEGGAALHVDELLVVNTPSGWLSATDVGTGQVRWALGLADPLADDIPRRLAPVLRGGALFVPAASVHIVRPNDGVRLGAGLPCDLVPDALSVDERGWVYVAEESGHLAAYAPVPHLALIRGGAS